MSKIKIIKTSVDEASIVYEILKVTGFDMFKNQGIENWWPPYPLEKIIDDINSDIKTVYLVEHDDVFVGTFTISISPPVYYDPAIWGDNNNAVYPVKLAVLPEYRNSNIGLWCIKQYEKIAKEQSFKYIRIDVYEKNSLVIEMHKRLGYKELGRAATNRFMVCCLEKEI